MASERWMDGTGMLLRLDWQAGRQSWLVLAFVQPRPRALDSIWAPFFMLSLVKFMLLYFLFFLLFLIPFTSRLCLPR
jgi:hypothetical protein